jgi:quercetin dioxygenase-like cupin family protein
MTELTINESDVPWDPAGDYHEGTEWKVLHRGPEDKLRAILLKLPPAFKMDAHAHVHTEHHYVLEGQYESQGRSFPAGSYRIIPAHANHGPFESASGAIILVIWEG